MLMNSILRLVAVRGKLFVRYRRREWDQHARGEIICGECGPVPDQLFSSDRLSEWAVHSAGGSELRQEVNGAGAVGLGSDFGVEARHCSRGFGSCRMNPALR